MTTSGITNINAKLIHQHPDNPRKDLGDLTELSESIKKKGIMQNLTVIPGYWDEKRTHHEEGYTLIIGHRRFAAGKMAGVTMYPCRIVEDMSYKDQVGTMLEENMQRIDLTPLEQAEGFQMMLDLGDTEEQIAEKTGFSRTTVRRRLEIAKLDRDLVKEKTDEDGAYQLNLKDLAQLSRIWLCTEWYCNGSNTFLWPFHYEGCEWKKDLSGNWIRTESDKFCRNDCGSI